MCYEKCSICGSPISETNTTGIGFGCMNNVVIPSKKECFNEVKGLDLWISKSTAVKNEFLRVFAGRKFRNNFKKSFYESMSKSEHVSKKQLDIMLDMLGYENITFDFYADFYKPMFDRFDPQSECKELYLSKISMHKKLYLSSRKQVNFED